MIYTSEPAGGPWYNDEHELRSVPIAGGASVLLSPTDAQQIDSFQLTVAPNGSRVLFQDRATEMLYTSPVDGSTPAVNLTPTLPQSVRISLNGLPFNTEGSRVFYRISGTDGEPIFDVRMQSATGGEPISLRGTLTTVGGSQFTDAAFNFVLSPDESFIVLRGAETQLGPRALYRVALPSSSLAPSSRRILVPLVQR